MENITLKHVNAPIKAAVFDFDGTVSLLRCGWEKIMQLLMMEMITGHGAPFDAQTEKETHDFIVESSGTPTILQMKWLMEHAIAARPDAGLATDPQWYKDEYDRRLMLKVNEKLQAIADGSEPCETYMVGGVGAFIRELASRGVALYMASGTDEGDVRNEAEALGMARFFKEIAGAKPGSDVNAKKTVISALMAQPNMRGEDIAVFGDGKTEIEIGKAVGARTVGMATSITEPGTVDLVKREPLVKAGADMIAADFSERSEMLEFVGLGRESMERRNLQLDTKDVKTYSAAGRHNLVRIDTLYTPGVSPIPEWNPEGLDELIERMKAAKENGSPIIFSMGAHVIKCGLSRYLIDLMKHGYITHIAGNGACSIHDFELGYLGGTSEHVPTAIEDGSFGMWEETGAWMNEAIKEGARDGIGYGTAIGRYMEEHPERFPHKEDSVWYNAYALDIPATNHIALGTDIIHQHPSCDFEAIGKASGIDFKKICYSVAHLDKGVYLNFGSGVIGPEVFLKALSIARNLGYPTFDITTANFDLIDLGDFRRPLGYEHPQYYYRPRKNIVNRPVSCGGWGRHFCGDHQESIPNIWKRLIGDAEVK